ncbi:recombinase family protein [Bacillus sp. 3255]|uniref:recombinase family protein n=1 Tax=Bacillus sp. 3255 TaxID=2817904 RepID=UPI0028631719|nr:recombinase family protein [Bacillus sp. 3255]MDR6883034.1 DNA invertase Pin-like site-specific DNA recombinase [Bacillus sp. 3255]
MKIGYARVSTVDQSLDSQIDELKKAGCERIYTEKASGAKDDRIELQKAIDALRPGDVFMVYKLDRLARSTIKLITTLDQIQKMGVEFVSISDKLDTTTAAGKALFGVLAVFAEFERNVIVERTKAGLAASRARGRNGGRPKTDPRKLTQALKLYDGQEHTVAEIAELTGVNRATLYRSLKERDMKAKISTTANDKVKMSRNIEKIVKSMIGEPNTDMNEALSP